MDSSNGHNWDALDNLVSTLQGRCVHEFSLHDVCDFYDTLANRLRYILQSQPEGQEHRGSRNLASGPVDTSAEFHLDYLQQRTASLAKCLQRDIARPLELKQPDSDSQDTVHCIFRSCMKLTNMIFTFESIRTLFSANDLLALLSLILKICKEGRPSYIYRHKVDALVFWVLRTQTLPLQVLASHAKPLLFVVKMILAPEQLPDCYREWQPSKRKPEIICDALKVIQNLLLRHPRAFLPHFVLPTKLGGNEAGVLENVLTHTVSPSPAIRHAAAEALGQFALGLLDIPDVNSEEERMTNNKMRIWIVKVVKEFTRPRRDPFNDKRNEIVPTPPTKDKDRAHSDFDRLILSSVDPHMPDTPGPSTKSTLAPSTVWATSVLASLMVLSNHSFFNWPFVRLVVEVIGSLSPANPAYSPNSRIVDGDQALRSWLRSALLKCLAWAFSQFPDSGKGKGRDNSADRMTKKWEDAFTVVKQELGCGVGAACVRALLRRSRLQADTAADDNDTDGAGGHLRRAVQIISEMIESPSSETRREGLAVLLALLKDIGPSPSCMDPCRADSSMARTLDKRVFNSTAISRSSGALTPEALTPVSISPAIALIPPMSEPEIVSVWDSLLDLWMEGVKMYIQSDTVPFSRISNDLLQAWQTLLLVEAQLTQGHEHLTTPPALVTRVTSVLAGLLSLVLDEPIVILSKVDRALRAVKELWTVFRNVYSASWLASASGNVQASVLNLQRLVEDVKIKELSSELLAYLVLSSCSSLPDALSALYDDERFSPLEVKRRLWSSVAKSWNKFWDGVVWQDLVSLLVIPFESWRLSESELKLWELLLSTSISMAESAFVKADKVIEEIIGRLNHGMTNRYLLTPRPVGILLGLGSLTPSLMILCDEYLAELYDAKQTSAGLEILHVLAATLQFIGNDHIPNVLSVMSNGLSRWLRDENGIVPDDQYNNSIMSFYTDILLRLQGIPPSTEVLGHVTPFLVSAFGRVPVPAIGPTAFKDFWEETYRDYADLRSHYSEGLKSCLWALHDVYGGETPPESSQSWSTCSFPFAQNQLAYYGTNYLSQETSGDAVDSTPRKRSFEMAMFSIPSSPDSQGSEPPGLNFSADMHRMLAQENDNREHAQSGQPVLSSQVSEGEPPRKRSRVDTVGGNSPLAKATEVTLTSEVKDEPGPSAPGMIVPSPNAAWQPRDEGEYAAWETAMLAVDEGPKSSQERASEDEVTPESRVSQNPDDVRCYSSPPANRRIIEPQDGSPSACQLGPQAVRSQTEPAPVLRQRSPVRVDRARADASYLDTFV